MTESETMNCPTCQMSVVTRVKTGATAQTHIIFILCCIFLCWPCAPCVYCCDTCLVKKHYCPRCNTFLGVVS
ncbi:lipopolysaccharide-induced tumor necrosis factor-alpha factor homolog [Copidosoma floridanum]|uniref:lipopolysaccharide-induced tumor necrosis factor-alpha factor homolog n=1 Tax=Copidosoma floridanum TaxID=29053 RepID=UPI0006C9E3E2|nr:lipopolysaccharide-induced tumor necrosis factor-alpha factor homolog [Copidosoma floridanum]